MREQDFLELLEVWKCETIFLSSPTTILQHPAAQKIIAEGTTVVPMLLSALERESDFEIMSILGLITQFYPFPNEIAGNVPEMREYWLSWGIEHGYLKKGEQERRV